MIDIYQDGMCRYTNGAFHQWGIPIVGWLTKHGKSENQMEYVGVPLFLGTPQMCILEYNF